VVYKRDKKHLHHGDVLNPDCTEDVLLLESIFGKEEERVSGVDLVDAKWRFYILASIHLFVLFFFLSFFFFSDNPHIFPLFV